jgi:hypothetical protein
VKPIRLISLLLLPLLFLSCNSTQNDPKKLSATSDTNKTIRFKQTEEISLINLIANPQKYEGQKVTIMGYLHLEFEGNGLYINKADFENSISKNAIWIEIGPKHPENSSLAKFIDHYVLLEGTFDEKNKGHMGMMSGSLKDITRLELRPSNVRITISK